MKLLLKGRRRDLAGNLSLPFSRAEGENACFRPTHPPCLGPASEEAAAGRVQRQSDGCGHASPASPPRTPLTPTRPLHWAPEEPVTLVPH